MENEKKDLRRARPVRKAKGSKVRQTVIVNNRSPYSGCITCLLVLIVIFLGLPLVLFLIGLLIALITGVGFCTLIFGAS